MSLLVCGNRRGVPQRCFAALPERPPRRLCAAPCIPFPRRNPPWNNNFDSNGLAADGSWTRLPLGALWDKYVISHLNPRSVGRRALVFHSGCAKPVVHSYWSAVHPGAASQPAGAGLFLDPTLAGFRFFFLFLCIFVFLFLFYLLSVVAPFSRRYLPIGFPCFHPSLHRCCPHHPESLACRLSGPCPHVPSTRQSQSSTCPPVHPPHSWRDGGKGGMLDGREAPATV